MILRLRMIVYKFLVKNISETFLSFGPESIDWLGNLLVNNNKIKLNIIHQSYSDYSRSVHMEYSVFVDVQDLQVCVLSFSHRSIIDVVVDDDHYSNETLFSMKCFSLYIYIYIFIIMLRILY